MLRRGRSCPFDRARETEVPVRLPGEYAIWAVCDVGGGRVRVRVEPAAVVLPAAGELTLRVPDAEWERAAPR